MSTIAKWLYFCDYCPLRQEEVWRSCEEVSCTPARLYACTGTSLHAPLCRFGVPLWEKKSEGLWQAKAPLWYNSLWKRTREKEHFSGLSQLSFWRSVTSKKGFLKPGARSSNTCPSTYRGRVLQELLRPVECLVLRKCSILKKKSFAFFSLFCFYL